MNNIENYFEGEKLQCIIGIIISVVCISFSVFFLFLDKPVLKGMAYSFISLSSLLLAICIGIVLRTPKDIERVTTFYKTERQKIQTVELPRMGKVMRNFTVIKKVELYLFLVGLLMTIFFWKNNLVKGIATGLMIQGGILYFFDYAATVRGKIYIELLKSF